MWRNSIRQQLALVQRDDYKPGTRQPLLAILDRQPRADSESYVGTPYSNGELGLLGGSRPPHSVILPSCPSWSAETPGCDS